jgi:hypothetical protein
MSNSSGLYILTCDALKEAQTIKLGTSMRLHERWHDYEQVFSNCIYIYCYEFVTHNTFDEILFVEKLILDKTVGQRNKKYAAEYRSMCYDNNNDIAEFHSLICDQLNELNIDFKVYQNHIFEKPVNNNFEKLNHDEELE